MSTQSEKADSNRVDQLKKELFDMQAKRKAIEDKLIEHRSILEVNKVGMKDSLTDKDDFPRNDIDIYAVRHARGNIIKLENDAKILFNEMQSKLEELHSLSK